MSLLVLAAVVVAGIGLIVAAVHLSGGSTGAVVADANAARECFALDFPDRTVRSVHLTRDRLSAFLALDDGRVGVVQVVGGKFLTRLASAASVVGAPRVRQDQVTIRFRDFTWPGGTFTFESEGEAEAVETIFARLRSRAIWDEAA